MHRKQWTVENWIPRTTSPTATAFLVALARIDRLEESVDPHRQRQIRVRETRCSSAGETDQMDDLYQNCALMSTEKKKES